MNTCEAIRKQYITMSTKQSDPLLKKRVNDWEHEVKKIITSPEEIFSFSYGDRFIPRRHVHKNIENNTKYYSRKKKDMLKLVTTDQFPDGYWRNHNFEIVFRDSFAMNNRRILQLSDKVVHSQLFSDFKILPRIVSHEYYYANKRGQDWPCQPRARPLAIPDTTHDLPGFDMFSDLNVITWSFTGQIAASFGSDLVLWSPNTDITLVYKIRNSKAVAYCPQGKYLAVGCLKSNWPVFEIWRLTSSKTLAIENGHVFHSVVEEVSCIEWEKTGKIILCGTESGSIYVFTVPKLSVLRKITDHKHAVFIMKFSPTIKYLATCDRQGDIFVFLWSACTVHVMLKSQRKLRSVFDWHPWNGVDLAISEDIPASIVILNVPSKQIVAYYQRKDYNVKIDSITFSKLSAELVVSCSVRNPDGCITSEILVMSSLDNIVDVLQTHEESVKFMMWSPDGTQLATAGSDETLTIWTFFGVREGDSIKKFKKRIDKKRKVQKDSDFGSLFSRLNTIR